MTPGGVTTTIAILDDSATAREVRRLCEERDSLRSELERIVAELRNLLEAPVYLPGRTLDSAPWPPPGKPAARMLSLAEAWRLPPVGSYEIWRDAVRDLSVDDAVRAFTV